MVFGLVEMEMHSGVYGNRYCMLEYVNLEEGNK